MLQSSFNLIKQHFSPTSQINKNIFLTKDSDYPPPFIQRLYIAYLELEEVMRTRPSEQIAKRISIVGGRNDKNFQKTVFGFVYAIMLHYPRAKKEQNEQKQRQKTKLLDLQYEQKITSEKYISQLTQYFTLFRNQTWSFLTSISLELLLTHFHQIKSIHRCGFISIFRHIQKHSTCQDEFFMAVMKTLNFYDQKNWSTRYNLELMKELGQIVEMTRKVGESGSTFKQEDVQKNCSRVKLMEQMSLMRHYLFGKLVHWQYMVQKMSSYLKSEWPFHLQRTCAQSLKMLKSLYQSNPEQCLVFSNEFSRYAQFSTSDDELKQILSAISQQSHLSIPSHMINHHFSLVPISIEFLIPFHIQQQINQMSRILYVLPLESGQHPRVEKQNVHMIVGWMWKDCLKEFSQENSKSNYFNDLFVGYLLENAFQDLVRYCLMSHTKNLELRSFIIEWVMYSSMHNEALFKTVKQAFFFDWLYYLKIAQQTDFNSFFAILTASLHILNYFVFCAPSLAESLFIYILGKNITLKTSYQSGPTSQGMFRSYINEILRRASRQGILRIKELLHQSQLSNFIKSELQIRIQEAENAGIQTYQQKDLTSKQSRQSLNESQIIPFRPVKTSISEQLYPTTQKSKYYGDKQLDLQLEIPGINHQNSDQEGPNYTSHQFIPASPTFAEEEEPQYVEVEENIGERFTLEQGKGYKRDNVVSPYVLEAQVQQGKMGNISSRQREAFSVQKVIQPKPITFSKTTPSLQPTSYQIQLQKQFLQQMGSSIQSLLLSPTVQQFTDYMKELIKILKQYKKSSQQEEMIEKFLQQTAKIIYLAFNKQFESFDFSIDQTRQTRESKFLSYFLLKSIHHSWKQALTVYNVFVYKKLVKYLCEAFSSCQFTFYYVFLDIFKKGMPNFKEMKAWLFATEREKIVVPVLQKILGNKFKINIYENAQALRIQ